MDEPQTHLVKPPAGILALTGTDAAVGLVGGVGLPLRSLPSGANRCRLLEGKSTGVKGWLNAITGMAAPALNNY